MRGIWKPLLLTGVFTPLLLSFTNAAAGLTVCLVCGMAAILVFAIEDRIGGQPATLHRAAVWLAILGLLPLVGWVDVATGFAVQVTLLYYIPIAIASWYLGALGMAVVVNLSILTWILAQMLTKQDIPSAVVVWNAIMMLVTFTVIAFAVRRERIARSRTAERPVLVGTGPHHNPVPR